jgi:hypothetical protein
LASTCGRRRAAVCRCSPDRARDEPALRSAHGACQRREHSLVARNVTAAAATTAAAIAAAISRDHRGDHGVGAFHDGAQLLDLGDALVDAQDDCVQRHS